MQGVVEFLAFVGARKSWNFPDFHAPPGSTVDSSLRDCDGRHWVWVLLQS